MKKTFFALILNLLIPSLWGGVLELSAPLGLDFPVEARFATEDSDWKRGAEYWTLESGQTGVVEFPAWWEGNRPPRGQLVVMELEYLDDFSHPVRAEVYSGLGTTRPYSELHRFGGTAAGGWQTARIPASADFIFRFHLSNSLRFRLTPKDGSLKVRRCLLVAPLPDEEDQYNSETRSWVRREQERAVISSRYYRLAQDPVIPGDWARQPLVPYLRNWMDIVRPISAPQPGEVGRPVRMRMFLNEFESAQVGVFANGVDLKGVVVSAEPLKDGSGEVVASVQVRVAEYSKVKGQLIPGFLIEPFPQRLWPAFPFDVESGQSHMVWVVVGTSEQFSKPGVYRSQLRFGGRELEPVIVPIEVEILDRRLLTMDEAGLKLGGCTTGLVPEFELGFLHSYNHNMVNIWYAGVRPILSAEGSSLGLDFQLMDDWMAAARRQGITDLVYFLGGNPYGFPQTMNLPRTLAAVKLGLDDDGWRRLAWKDPASIPEQVAELMVEWTRRFAEHAKEENWPNVILTPFDEPAKYTQYRPDLGMLSFIKPQFKQQIRLLRKANPGVQIYGSIHHYDPGMDFLEDVDVFCTNAVQENLNLPDEVRAAGKTLWEYSGNADKGLPGVARYTFGFYFASHDSRGSLVWAYNWGNRFDTLDGDNWMYAWNTPFDVIPTPYMEGLREAWDDRRLLETLKAAARDKGVDLSGFLGRLFAEVSLAQGQGGTNTLDDFWETAKEDQVMDQWRARMVEQLLAIGHQN